MSIKVQCQSCQAVVVLPDEVALQAGARCDSCGAILDIDANVEPFDTELPTRVVMLNARKMIASNTEIRRNPDFTAGPLGAHSGADSPADEAVQATPNVTPNPSATLSINVAVALTLLALIAGGLYFFIQRDLGGGRLEGTASFKGLQVTERRSFLYPTGSGQDALLFQGEVENRSTEARRGFDAVAQLVDDKGRVAYSARAPVGVIAPPLTLGAVTSAAELQTYWVEWVEARGVPDIAPGAKSPFLVVLLEPPEDPSLYQHRITFEMGRPLPTPAVSPAPVDIAPEFTDEPRRRRKGKGKRRKGKGKRRKLKSKVSPLY